MRTSTRAQHRASPTIRHLLLTQPFARDAWESAAAHDLHVRIGNAAPVIGKSAALAELDRFFARITAIGAGFCETCRSKETLFAEVEVEFRDGAGLPRGIPCVVVVRLTGGALLDVRFHLDPTPIPR
jgi:hypothetical protein